jgi:hypothetical protein
MTEKHWVTVLVHAQHSRRCWWERWFPTRATVVREAAELAQQHKEAE